MARMYSPLDCTQEGRKLIQSGQSYQAIELFTKLLNDYSRDPKRRQYEIFYLLRQRGEIYLSLNDISHALDDISETLNTETFPDIKPSDRSNSFFLRGRIYLEHFNYKKAMTDFQAGLKDSLAESTSLAEVYYQLGVCHLKLGQSAQACSNFKLALSLGYIKLDLEIHLSAARIICNRTLESYLDYLDQLAKHATPSDMALIHQIRGEANYSCAVYTEALIAFQKAMVSDQAKTDVTTQSQQRRMNIFILINDLNGALVEANKIINDENRAMFTAYISGLKAYFSKNAVEAIQQLSLALNHKAAATSLISHLRLFGFYLLCKLDSTQSLDPIIAILEDQPSDSLQRYIVKILIDGLPGREDKETFITNLKKIISDWPPDVFHPLYKDEFIAAILKAAINLPEDAFTFAVRYKETYLNLLFDIKDAALRQTALLQALLPETFFGALFNVKRELFTPTIKTSTNKQQIAVALIEEVTKHGVLFDRETIRLLKNNTAVIEDMRNNSPQLDKILREKGVLFDHALQHAVLFKPAAADEIKSALQSNPFYRRPSPSPQDDGL